MGLEFQVVTRMTAWSSFRDAHVDGGTGARGRRERLPPDVPKGASVDGLGLRLPTSGVSGPPGHDEKTRVTAVAQRPALLSTASGTGNDCLIAIYSKEPTFLGKRFVLHPSQPTRIGRGTDNGIVLDSDFRSRAATRASRPRTATGR